MITGIERILVEVPDLKQAKLEYKAFFGDIISHDQSSSIIVLNNSAIELRHNPFIKKAKINGITLLDENKSSKPKKILPKPRGLNISSIGKRGFSNAGAPNNKILSIDHLVLLSNDLDDCIEEFGTHRLGIRLALDKTEPKWGGRMLFFRAGKFTLEIIQNNSSDSQRKDHFWGIAYLCSDIELTIENLQKKDVVLSSIREGRKKGTLVATVKSHNLGLPTLLIQNK